MIIRSIETLLGVMAPAHFAASRENIVYYDFDVPLMLQSDLITGGILYEGEKITFARESGLGITAVHKVNLPSVGVYSIPH